MSGNQKYKFLLKNKNYESFYSLVYDVHKRINNENHDLLKTLSVSISVSLRSIFLYY